MKSSLDKIRNFVSITNNINCKAEIDIGYLSNIKDNTYTVDSIIELNETHLSFSDFISCFYSTPGHSFNINPVNIHFKPLSLLSQTYNTVDSKNLSWNILNECMRAYSVKNEVSENTISPKTKILLSREVFSQKSLAGIMGDQVSLSWEEVLVSLTNNGSIRYTGDIDHNANVVFKITYIFYSSVLNTCIGCIFRFHSEIPCYRNVYNSEELGIYSPYSKFESSARSSKLLPKKKYSSYLQDNRLSNEQELNSVDTQDLIKSLKMKYEPEIYDKSNLNTEDLIDDYEEDEEEGEEEELQYETQPVFEEEETLDQDLDLDEEAEPLYEEERSIISAITLPTMFSKSYTNHSDIKKNW